MTACRPSVGGLWFPDIAACLDPPLNLTSLSLSYPDIPAKVEKWAIWDSRMQLGREANAVEPFPGPDVEAWATVRPQRCKTDIR